MTSFALFDIDNCISDDDWRVAFIKNGDVHPDEKYEEYHSFMMLDKAYNQHIVNHYPNVLYVTSRPEKWAFQTNAWLKANGFKKGKLLMRPRDNHMPSKELKPYLLKRAGISPSDIYIAYDDREDVLKAYDKLRILTVKMALHSQELSHA